MNTSLDRFIEAQRRDYAVALEELRQGEKKTHWIWYVLPQGLFPGAAGKSLYYALKDDAEAVAYLSHPDLGKRYAECIAVIHAQIIKHGIEPEALMGSDVDAKKLHSSLTLMLRALKSAALQDNDKARPWLADLRRQAAALIPRLPKF